MEEAVVADELRTFFRELREKRKLIKKQQKSEEACGGKAEKCSRMRSVKRKVVSSNKWG